MNIPYRRIPSLRRPRPGARSASSATRRATLRTAAALAAGLGMGLPGSVAAQASVTLDFGWPATSARVVTEMTTVAGNPMGPRSDTTSLAATLTVERVPEGYRIAYADYDFGGGLGLDSLEQAAALEPGRMAELLEMAQQASPDILVSPDGAFLQIADPADLQPILDAMASIFDEVQAMAPNPMLAGMRERLLDPATWNTTLAAAWDEQVGKWRGSWTAGQVRADTTAFPNPLGDEPLPMRQELSFEGFEDCPDGSGRCAVLVGMARSDAALQDRFQALMNDMMAQMGAPPEMSVEVSELDVKQTTRVHFRPDGMIPIQSRVTVETHQVMAVMGREQATDQTQVTRVTWDWEN